MKKKDTDFQDIYHTEDRAAEPLPAATLSETIRTEISRRRIFTVCVILLTLILAAVILPLLVRELLPGSYETVPLKVKKAPLPVHHLPEAEQWVMEYRQVALQADSSEPAGPKPLSSKWIKNTAYHIIMGEQALRQGEPAAAQSHLETVVSTFPAITGIRSRLGAAYLSRQYFQKADEQLQLALKEDRSAEVLNNLGAARMGLEDYSQAEILFRQALELNPDLSGCRKNLAVLYQKTGRIDEAVTAFEHYFSLHPRDTGLLENYIIFLTGAGRANQAADFLDRIQGADPLAVRLLLARTAAQAEDTERAVQALRDAAAFLTPRQVIAEMNDAAFSRIAKTEPFQTLMYQLELAAVSHSTDFSPAVKKP